MTTERLTQRKLRADARREILAEVPMLSADQVGAMAGAAESERSVVAHRLVQDRRIFSIRHRGTDLIPAFQLTAGQPNPAIALVLQAFEGEAPWSVAKWFCSPSGWLGGDRPIDRIHDEPDLVVEAARRTASPLAV